MKRGRGFAVTPAQRLAVRDKLCLHCGREGVDPAHLWDRSRGGCDHPLCVVPLCRECHRKYDEKKLDIAAQLVNVHGGYFAQMAHVIEAHRVSPLRLLERISAIDWRPR